MADQEYIGTVNGTWMKVSEITEAVLAPSAILMLICYHCFLCYRARTHPTRTIMAINLRARRLWVNEMLKDNQKKNVLAVQTLRNSIMESTLMATTAVILCAGMATYFTFAVRHLSSAKQQLPASPTSTSIKSLLVFVCFLMSFLFHTQSIRFLNHINYMINVPSLLIVPTIISTTNISTITSNPAATTCTAMATSTSCSSLQSAVTADDIADLMERSTIFYVLGSRSLYIGFPLILWVFGSLPLFITSLFLLHCLYKSDFINHNNNSAKCSATANHHTHELPNTF